MDKKMLDALNKQIKMEFDSAYLYLAMSAWFESKNLGGFASWLKLQHQEELNHGHKIYHHIFERAETPVVPAIDQPPAKWASPVEAFQAVYQHEQKVTASIHSLVKTARSLDDYATENFLQWFVAEQVEEESTALEILEHLKMIGDAPGAIFQLNGHMYKRGKD